MARRGAKTGKFVSKAAATRHPRATITEHDGASGATGFRSATSGRYVSQAERIAAARARVTADQKRNVRTDAWIVDLAKKAG